MIAIFGIKTFCDKLITQLNKQSIQAEFIGQAIREIDFTKIDQYSIIHFMFSPTISPRGFFTLLRLKQKKKKIIVSWIGTDVLLATTKFLPKLLSKMGKNLVDYHICVSENLQNELRQINIDSELQPLPNFTIFKIKDLPKTKKIAVYLPDKDEKTWKFYQGDLIKKLVNEFTNLEFIILGNSGKKFSEKNVECIKWTNNMEQIYENVIAVIRLPQHDGLSNTILEVLSMGRMMISSPAGIPFCKEARSYEEVKKFLKEVIQNPKLNSEASAYVSQKYNKEKITSDLIEKYNKISNSII